MTQLLFILAAGFGGALRYVVEVKLPPAGATAFPRATLMVNIVGAFVLGFINDVSQDLRLIVGTALCGALTTFSSVSLQTHRRLIARAYGQAALYVATLVGLGIAAAAVGVAVSHALFA